jgi:hypothetical protein
MEWQTCDNLRRENFILDCRRAIWIIISNVQPYRWQCTRPRRDWKKSSTEVWREKDFTFRISQQGSILMISFSIVSRFLFESMYSKILMPDSLSPSSSVKFEIIMVLSLGSGSGSGFSASSRMLCLRIQQYGLHWDSDHGFQQLEDIFRIVHTNWRTWFDIWASEFSMHTSQVLLWASSRTACGKITETSA